MVLKLVKLPKFLVVWHESFLHTSIWVFFPPVTKTFGRIH